MNKLLFAAVTGAFLISAPVHFAQAADAADVSADVGAVNKDDTALAKDHARTKKHRAKKAAAKANGDVVGQAGNSVAIGADKTVTGEKNVEKNVDQKILNHDANDQQ